MKRRKHGKRGKDKERLHRPSGYENGALFELRVCQCGPRRWATRNMVRDGRGFVAICA